MRRFLHLLKRTLAELQADNLTDWAAALTYYGLLSLFPALIALVSVLALVGDPRSTISTLHQVIASVGPKSAVQTFAGPVRTIASDRGAAGFAFVVGMAVALWSASGYVGAFIRASNVIYESDEGRPFWRLRPLQIGVTLATVLIAATIALALVLTGPLVDAVAKPIGVGSAAVGLWEVAKWPVLAALFVVMVSILYYCSPNAVIRGFRWVTPGSLIAIVVWGIASAAFAFYVASFGSYDRTYGTLGGVIVALVWLWLTNLAILAGHEFNAELERGLEIDEGRHGAAQEIQLQPRIKPK